MFPDHLTNFFDTINAYPKWQVAIELLIIGSFVYMAVKFMQGTRGARMLKGAATVLIGFYLLVRLVGQRYDLTRIAFLYEKFLLIASFAAVVVFQPELRRALMRLGDTRLFRTFSNQIFEEVDALVDSAKYLSRQKIGALIAIEREINLGGIAETGTKIDAQLSSALLNTIFWPNSPLHDLGVVISAGRVAYAGVQFPLAESDDMPDQQLGSRHRAAVGLSQESDAVVIVCSEETGDISVAEKGRLIRRIKPDKLHDLLTELLVRGDVTPTTTEETKEEAEKVAA